MAVTSAKIIRGCHHIFRPVFPCCVSRCPLHSQRMVHLQCHPVSALVDQKVEIKVCHLPANQKVTLRAQLVEGKKRYSSVGHFISDASGEVDVTQTPSAGGTYNGLDQMGLLWSLKPEPRQREGVRLVKRDVTTPFIVDIKVYREWLEFEELCDAETDLSSVASCQIQRWYLDVNKIRRIPVRDGNIRGTLFMPKDGHKFPCVIDMFGTGGGCFEHRAALLASRAGYAVIALAFTQYEDLTDDLNDVDLAYFEEALDWMIGQPFCSYSGVAVVATSAGGDIALSMARHFKKKVIAAAVVNPSCRLVGFPARFRDEEYPKFLSTRYIDFVVTKQGLENRNHHKIDFNAIPDNEIIKVEEATANFLLIQSGDDRLIDTVNHFQLTERLKKLRDPPSFEAALYTGAGHLLEPPYAPLASNVFQTNLGYLMFYGGVPHLHNKAQVSCWRRILSFLERNFRHSADTMSAASKL